jgi:hypothetical protein
VCEKTLAEKLWDMFEELLKFMIEAIAANGPMDITQLRHTQEYAFVKEIFESTFLFKQQCQQVKENQVRVAQDNSKTSQPVHSNLKYYLSNKT